MEINIHENSKRKYVSIWLTREESSDPKVDEMIKEAAPKFKAKGYNVVIYESGTKPLIEVTKNCCYTN